MPVTLSAAEIVASEIRCCMQRYDINFDYFVSLLRLSEGEWRNLMISHAPNEECPDLLGGAFIARIKL